jgi:methionine-R-sulfoxide reductase
MAFKKLTNQEEQVIIHKGTEAPFSGAYWDNKKSGQYFCKQCAAHLFNSDDKFESGCGWPSFDDEVGNSVKKITDADGFRVEIICNNCGGHLGHIFKGERLTDKNVRYCVNSISLCFKE